MVATATEGGTQLFPISYFDREAFLNQSPQLYKQIMTAAGLERVFEVGPIFRAEEHDTRKHLNEVTSIDIEASFLDDREVMELLEELIQHVYVAVAERCSAPLQSLGVTPSIPHIPFKPIAYAEAIDATASSRGPVPATMIFFLSIGKPDFTSACKPPAPITLGSVQPGNGKKRSRAPVARIRLR